MAATRDNAMASAAFDKQTSLTIVCCMESDSQVETTQEIEQSLKSLVIEDPLTKVDPPSESEEVLPALVKKGPNPFAYRHYQPFYACCNKILAMKWDKKLRSKHIKKIAAAKATVDNASPRPYMHLQMKLKKLQMEQGGLD